MPFGLIRAPAVFQALVYDLVWDILNKFVFVYLDDMNMCNMCSVFFKDCWRTSCLLGFIVTAGSIQVNSTKVKAVMDWPSSGPSLPRRPSELECHFSKAPVFTSPQISYHPVSKYVKLDAQAHRLRSVQLPSVE